jgi:hypothetical protein
MRKEIHEAPQSVNQSLYTSVNFKDGVVGNSTPSRDKINPSLLADIEAAAKKVGVTVSVTTAVTGHRAGSRHETGHAVDIAMVNGLGFSSKADAEKKGIYQAINSFVQALSSMGYVINTESGNDKAVLTFGFPNHDNHVHISRKSDNGESTPSTTQTTTTPTKTTKTNASTTTKTTTSPSSSSPGEDHGVYDFLDKALDPLKSMGDAFSKKWDEAMSKTQKESIDEETNMINEEINRIKQIMKS